MSKFVDAYEKKPVRAIPYNHSDYKHTIEDALKRFFSTDGKYKETHTLTDTKLVLGYGACAFAAYGSLKSYYNPFQESKVDLIISVIGYFILNSLLLLHTYFKVGDLVYQGTSRTHQINVAYKTKKHSDKVSITIHITDKKSKKVGKSSLKDVSFGGWFDEEGQFVAKAFRESMVGLVKGCGGKVE